MKLCKLDRDLARLAARYERDAAVLIAAARLKYVVPFCDRTGLAFAAGMGTWAFYDAAGNPIYGEGYNDALPARLLAVLRAEVHTSRNDAGSLMEDYTPKVRRWHYTPKVRR